MEHHKIPTRHRRAILIRNQKKKLRGVVVVLRGRPVLLDKIGIPGAQFWGITSSVRRNTYRSLIAP